MSQENLNDQDWENHEVAIEQKSGVPFGLLMVLQPIFAAMFAAGAYYASGWERALFVLLTTSSVVGILTVAFPAFFRAITKD